jgi:acyl carrier protein
MRRKIKEVLQSVLDIDNVPEDISQDICPEWDSMHQLQLVVELEIEFGVSFEPDDIVNMKSLNLIEETLRRLLD